MPELSLSIFGLLDYILYGHRHPILYGNRLRWKYRQVLLGYWTKFYTVIYCAGTIAKYLRSTTLHNYLSGILSKYEIRVIQVRVIRVKLGLNQGQDLGLNLGLNLGLGFRVRIQGQDLGLRFRVRIQGQDLGLRFRFKIQG